MGRLKRSRLVEILESFKDLSAIVVGDFALDVYWYADMTMSELSRETPRYTRPIVRETYSPGASGNISWNLRDLGVRNVYAVTVIGEDWRGQILVERLKDIGVRTEYMIQSPDRVTPSYIKPILCGFDSQQEDSRLDFINLKPISSDLEEHLIDNIEDLISVVNAVIVEDQMSKNGVISDYVRQSLIDLAGENPEKVFVVNSRERIGLFKNMVLKPNKIEAVKALYPFREPSEVEIDELVIMGRELFKRANRPVYITLGEKGALLIDEEGHSHLPAAPTKPPIDPVGAGDTFISAIGASLAAGASPLEAGIIANIAASVILKKLNITGTASPKEILDKFDEISKGDEWP
ncbi:MAG: PfkB family carbohydrate kinase [Candidatus Bathyarchaeia archaeon]